MINKLTRFLLLFAAINIFGMLSSVTLLTQKTSKRNDIQYTVYAIFSSAQVVCFALYSETNSTFYKMCCLKSHSFCLRKILA